MNEPPDPGGTAPPAAAFVTISNESGMDSDCSLVSKRKLKRSHLHKVCKQCNKRKRKINSETCKQSECHCKDEFAESTVDLPASGPCTDTFLMPVPSTSISPKDPTQIGRASYDANDHGPFVVHVQKIQSADDDGTTLHPVVFGRFLKKNLFNNIVNGSLKRIGRNKMTLSFNNYTDANSFVTSNCLSANNMKAFIPTFNITRMGLVRGVPTEWSPEDIIENTNVPIGCGEILKIRRLNYKVMVNNTPTWKPSQTVVFTFDGQVLPKRVFMCYNSMPVKLYIYPTIQCFNCCRFGHTKAQCRSKPRCYKCGQGHTGDTCNVEEDRGSCCLCSGLHFASSKKCPEYVRQTNIKVTMAENSLSYIEASKLHPPISKSFADIVSSLPTKSLPGGNTVLPGSPPPRTISYKKTVFTKPRTPPQHSKGFDHVAHESLVRDYNMPEPSNGCALLSSSNTNSQQTIAELITTLIKLLSQPNSSIPSHAANLITTYTDINNGQHGQVSSMELPQCYKQKA